MAAPVYHIYIVTNKTKSVLYTGRTDDLPQRVIEHWLERGKPRTFAGRYHCHYLVYFEDTRYVLNAIEREKEIKGWTRAKKEALITEFNPEWKFLNEEIMEWPPIDPFHRNDFYE
ncbi:MAG: GIY-YIG nuclease family protein [Roseivirga sp.]|nr:GIY-YIG nuclease family protein [Roseivirga sp.]